MNKFEQGSVEHSQDNPNNRTEKIEKFSVPKLKRALEENGSLTNPSVERKLESVIDQLGEKFTVDVSEDSDAREAYRNKILRMAIEQIAMEHGGIIPEKLDKGYMKILAHYVVGQIGGDDDVYGVLKPILADLKERNIDVDVKELEETVNQLYWTSAEHGDESA